MLSPPSSSMSPFCSSLWPSWFLLPFTFFHLPPSLPPCRVLAGEQSYSVVFFRVALICLKTPLSLRPGQVIWSVQAKTSQPTTKGVGCVCECTCVWEEFSKSLSKGAGVLKIVTVFHGFTWRLEKDSVFRETTPLRGLEGGCGNDILGVLLCSYQNLMMGIVGLKGKKPHHYQISICLYHFLASVTWWKPGTALDASAFQSQYSGQAKKRAELSEPCLTVTWPVI